jgi:hypothetical protein
VAAAVLSSVDGAPAPPFPQAFNKNNEPNDRVSDLFFIEPLLHGRSVQSAVYRVRSDPSVSTV